ncbi:MAG: hypothetical protein HGA36_00375 [Candidatus Moranbacteria bacterium]|nr:hypothetical protein [Candidatus Moranbacteria bacterium]
MRQLESFFWGIIAALGALIIELVVFVIFSMSTSSVSDISFSQLFSIPQLIIAGACTEEIFKYIIISKKIDLLSLKRSYIMNSFLMGAGFFATELALISISGALPEIQILSEIAIIHIGTAGIIGYFVAIKNPKKISTILQTILVATFFHGSYNLLILNRTFVMNYAILGLLAMLILYNFINIFRINSKLAQN